MKKDFIKAIKTIKTNVGEFQYVNTIGEGGNSNVYKYEKDGKFFAIKFLKFNSDDNKIKRFQDEYFALSQLPDKKGIIEQYHFEKINIEQEDFFIIISKLYEMSLSKFKKMYFDFLPEKIKKETFKYIFKYLGETLDKIHKNGIIHRDIKPENIFVCYDVENSKLSDIVLGDFGIAHFDDEYYSKESKTKSGERLGNRDFSAPEQSIKDSSITESADMFSFGQILFWLKYGKPYKGILKIEENLINSIIEKCLMDKPNKRFQSYSDIELYIEDHINKNKDYDVHSFLFKFDDFIRRSYPEIDQLAIISDKNEIYKFTQNLNKINEGNNFWYMTYDEGDNHLDSINPSKISNETYIFDKELEKVEIDIKDIILFRDENDLRNDLIIIRTNAMSPFEYYNEENNKRIVDEDDHAYIINNKAINPNTVKSGYIRNENGDSTRISDLGAIYVTRKLKPYLYVLAPRKTALNDWRRDKGSIQFLSRIIGSDNIVENIKLFLKHIQKRSASHEKLELYK